MRFSWPRRGGREPGSTPEISLQSQRKDERMENSMTNISDTINGALSRDVVRNYGSYVRRVVDAVSNREDQIKANLRRYAEGRGLSSREVDDLFIEVGLAERPVAQATGDPV